LDSASLEQRPTGAVLNTTMNQERR